MTRTYSLVCFVRPQPASFIFFFFETFVISLTAPLAICRLKSRSLTGLEVLEDSPSLNSRAAVWSMVTHSTLLWAPGSPLGS